MLKAPLKLLFNILVLMRLVCLPLEKLKVCPVVFVKRSKVGAHSSAAFNAFISTAEDWN